MSHWPKERLGNLLIQVSRDEKVEPDGEYQLLGVRLEGNGAFIRECVTGTETSAAKLNRVKAGDFIYSRLFAWRGAFGIIGKELNDSYVSNEFPIFNANEKRLNPIFLNRWFQLPTVWKRVEEDCTGSTPLTRNRYKEKFFVNLEIPLPPLTEQLAIVARLDALADKVRQVEEHLDTIERDAEHLLAVRFKEATENAPMRKMAEVAPAVRRQVDIDITASYREVGARSFGKGLFVKPDFDGAEATWQKPVWIEVGDLVLSNIKAWEGAIAVAQNEHSGCIASHRYITCVPEPKALTVNFLHYYLLSPDGLEKVGLASPGTADRNRTLSLTNLGKIEVPAPPIAIQKSFDALKTKVVELKTKHTAIREANQALIPAMLERIFGATS